jgi:hypothetical protein
VPGGKPGCLKGCLSLLIIIAVLVGLVLLVAYRRLGSEGIKTWLAIRTLDNLKRRILEIENLDIPSKEIEEKIERARKRLREGKGDLKRLYRAMDKLEREMRTRITSSRVRELLKEIMDSVEVEIEGKPIRSPR